MADARHSVARSRRYAAWALVCGLILFGTIRSTIGLRVDRRIEEDGLDYYEHGETSYNS